MEKIMLPKTAEYALRATLWLGRTPDCAQSADELAKSIQAPRRYLHKVLQDLVKAGLVRSQSGPGGGYSLDRSPDDISILDVVVAVGPIERIQSCPLGLESHTRLCPLHKKLDDAYAAMEKAFREVTIGEILRSTSKITPLVEINT
jgi:Rrf2 family protein